MCNLIFKDIPLYPNTWKACSDGHIWSFIINKRFPEPHPLAEKDYKGWKYVNLRKIGAKQFKPVPVHRIIASAWSGRPLLQTEHAHHRNKIRSDNHPENIKIMNESEHNSLHNTNKSEESKRKMSQSHKGKKLSPQSIAKREETKRQKKLLDPNYGKYKRSEQWKQKHSQRMKLHPIKKDPVSGQFLKKSPQ